ncbi:MAG: glutathione-dependent reductase [Rickettsiales bacterium]|nr:glutathione-dependent reductase [Rickettsiales bacterium]
MGKLVKGEWTQAEYLTEDGEFKRWDSVFRNAISTEEGARFAPESGRYHLYVSHACPWAHRAVIMRKLKGLEPHISLDVVHPHMLDNGWELRSDYDGATGDRLNGYDYMYQLYQRAESDYSGRVTVPTLWDTKEQTIVNNESSEIIRMFNSAFDEVTGNHDDYYPEALREEIDAVNERVYEAINNGVYKVGFAGTQDAYDKAIVTLFDALDWLESRLSDGREWLVEDQLTEADIRLFTTLIRFDSVYYVHFKCNLRRIADYPHLSAYLNRVYGYDGIADTVNLDHIKQHYYYSHDFLNPKRIVPAGPVDPL